MIVDRHDRYPDHFELAIRLDATDGERAALRALGGATISDTGDGQVLATFTWPAQDGVDDATQSEAQRREAKALIEQCLASAAPAGTTPTSMPGVGDQL